MEKLIINNSKHKISPKFKGASKPHHFNVEEYDENMGFFDTIKRHSYIQKLLTFYDI